MRPIVLGLLVFIASGYVWLYAAGLCGSFSPGYTDTVATLLGYVFAVMFFLCLPVAIIAEIILWRRQRKKA